MTMKKIATAALAALALNANAADMMHGGHGQHGSHPHMADMKDTRKEIALNDSERAMILTEMRQFLAGVQTITNAIGTGDMEAVSKAAKKLGRGMMGEVPMSLRQKLPMEFRQFGMNTHDDFDQMALDAASLKDGRHALFQLSGVLQKCVACHEIFQITPEGMHRH
jgi:hypothetical protein